MSHQLEPFTGKEVIRWLEHRGARQLVVPGGGLRQYEVAPGRVVKIGQDKVPTIYAKAIAAAAGMTYPEFRAAMGHPIVVGGRPRRQEKRRPATTCGKADLAAVIRRSRAHLAEVERAVSQGVRDAAFYQRVLTHLADAERAALAALDETNRTGVR